MDRSYRWCSLLGQRHSIEICRNLRTLTRNKEITRKPCVFLLEDGTCDHVSPEELALQRQLKKENGE